jgi:hypothetical protein
MTTHTCELFDQIIRLGLSAVLLAIVATLYQLVRHMRETGRRWEHENRGDR